MQILDAYYSSEAAELHGYAIYKNGWGREVTVTEVVTAGKKPGSVWEDLRFVGKVIEFVESYPSLIDVFFDELYDREEDFCRNPDYEIYEEEYRKEYCYG